MLDLINPLGLTATLAILVAWLTGAYLLINSSDTRSGVWLGIVLLVEGCVLFTSYPGPWLLLEVPFDRWSAWGMQKWHFRADLGLVFTYPIFLAHALPVGILRPLRRWTGKIAIAAIVLGIFFVVRREVNETGTVAFPIQFVALLIVFVTALIVSIIALIKSKTQLAWQRAVLFSIAFGIRDIAWLFVYGTTTFEYDVGSWKSQLYAGSTLIYLPLVVYAILTFQLLDIDLRLRKTIKRSTLAAMFIALFFLISEGAASTLSDTFGDLIGLVLASILVFLLAPLHRLADWFSTRVVPERQNSDFEAFKKLSIYSTGLEDALVDGPMTPAKRSLLEKLRESLEISPNDAQRIEAEFTATTHPI